MAIEIPTAYTPGPWEVEDNHGAQIERSRYENGAFVVYAPDECEHHPIADLSCNHTCRDEDECRANANLVALAPQMADEIARLRAENARLREALEPFVRAGVNASGLLSEAYGDDWHELICTTLGDLRRAAASLASEPKLGPCPWCGPEAVILNRGVVTCENAACPLDGVVMSLADWNRRPCLHLPEPGTPEWDAAVEHACAVLMTRMEDFWEGELVAMVTGKWMAEALLAAAGRTE